MHRLGTDRANPLTYRHLNECEIANLFIFFIWRTVLSAPNILSSILVEYYRKKTVERFRDA